MIEKKDTTALWDYEYSSGHVIPSSTRNAPSQALLLFEELVGFRNMKRALDAGCGNGRNSLYLASLGLKVDSLDISSVALKQLYNRALKLGLADGISIHQSNLNESLSFESEIFDLCLDLYVLCHFTDEKVKRSYVSELWRVTKPGGYTISSLFPPWDGYYNPLIKGYREPIFVEDPANNISKQLYTKEDFKRCFSPPFKIQYFTELEFEDVVQGKSYHRNILSIVLRKT